MEPAELADSEKSPTWPVIANLKQWWLNDQYLSADTPETKS